MARKEIYEKLKDAGVTIAESTLGSYLGDWKIFIVMTKTGSRSDRKCLYTLSDKGSAKLERLKLEKEDTQGIYK
jgi:hypothetical protein